MLIASLILSLILLAGTLFLDQNSLQATADTSVTADDTPIETTDLIQESYTANLISITLSNSFPVETDDTPKIKVSDEIKISVSAMIEIEEPEPTPAPSSTGSTVRREKLPYLIYVSKDSFTIAILGLDANGEYTKLIHTFHTAIGRTNALTRAGTFTITSRERWHHWGGGESYSPYVTKHSGGLFFHGPVFTSRDSNTLKVNSFNEIGTRATAGCLRTYTSAAKWIYDNCANGTTVIIANDSKYSSSHPGTLNESQNYDPTDPNAVKPAPEVTAAPSPTVTPVPIATPAPTPTPTPVPTPSPEPSPEPPEPSEPPLP